MQQKREIRAGHRGSGSAPARQCRPLEEVAHSAAGMGQSDAAERAA